MCSFVHTTYDNTKIDNEHDKSLSAGAAGLLAMAERELLAFADRIARVIAVIGTQKLTADERGFSRIRKDKTYHGGAETRRKHRVIARDLVIG